MVAGKYDGSDRRGRCGPDAKRANSVHKLVLRMVAENEAWGCGRMDGELKCLGYKVSW